MAMKIPSPWPIQEANAAPVAADSAIAATSSFAVVDSFNGLDGFMASR